MKTSHNVGFFPLLAISCGHPGVPANAILSGDKFTYGSIIHYSCTAGRRLIGNSTRECQEDSHWSGTLPHCSGTWTNWMSPCHMSKAVLTHFLANFFVYFPTIFSFHQYPLLCITAISWNILIIISFSLSLLHNCTSQPHALVVCYNV